jgi:hypothetical protein
MNETKFDRYIQLAAPVLGQNLLVIEDIDALPDDTIVLGLFPMAPKESLYQIVRRQHHDRISTYAVPYNIYKPQPAKWQYEITGYGQYTLGNGPEDIRLWIPPEPVEPIDEGGDVVWATMIF